MLKLLEKVINSPGSGTDLPFSILLLATISSIFATILSIWTVILQLKNYRKLVLQRFVVRILIMVPIYSIASLVSLYSLDLAFFIDAVRDIYEAFVIYCFFTLLVEYLGGERSLIILLHGREPVPHPWPFSHFFNPLDCSDPYTFLGLKRGVLQYVQIKPVLAIVTVILKATGHYHEGYFARNSGYAYISVIYNFSVALALYCLAMFWIAVHSDLQPFRPTPKFLCVKGILFFTFWQGIGISILVAWGWLKSDRYPTELLGLAVQDTLICFEMPLFAFLHLYAFSYTDYIDKNHTYSGRLPFLYALRDAFGFKDVLSDSFTTVKGSGFSYRTFEPASSTLHSSPTLSRRLQAGLRYSHQGNQTTKYWLPMPGSESDAHGRKGIGSLISRPIHSVKRILEERLIDNKEGYAPLSEEDEERILRRDEIGESEEGERFDEGEYREWRKRNGEDVEGDDGESDVESLVFGEEGEEVEALYEDAKELEFGDYNYPILDASQEEVKKKLRDEEEGLINRHRDSPLFTPNGTTYSPSTNQNRKGKGKSRELNYDYFTHPSESQLPSSTIPQHPSPSGQPIMDLARNVLNSITNTTTEEEISPNEETLTTTSSSRRSSKKKNELNQIELPEDAKDLVVQDFEAEEEEMIKDRRRGEPSGKKKRVYRATYLSTPISTPTSSLSGNNSIINGGAISPLILSSSSNENEIEGLNIEGINVEIKDKILENNGLKEGEMIETVRLIVQEEEREAIRIETPEIFLEGSN